MFIYIPTFLFFSFKYVNPTHDITSSNVCIYDILNGQSIQPNESKNFIDPLPEMFSERLNDDSVDAVPATNLEDVIGLNNTLSPSALHKDDVTKLPELKIPNNFKLINDKRVYITGIREVITQQIFTR